MTITWDCKKKGCYKDVSLPDWGMLDGCFLPVTKNLTSDIDGVIHQNGRCLFLEKKFPNGDLSEPQVRTINSLVAQGNSYIAIWCVHPKGKDISLMRVWGIPGYNSQVRASATLKDFRTAVKTWWSAVYEKGKV